MTATAKVFSTGNSQVDGYEIVAVMTGPKRAISAESPPKRAKSAELTREAGQIWMGGGGVTCP